MTKKIIILFSFLILNIFYISAYRHHPYYRRYPRYPYYPRVYNYIIIHTPSVYYHNLGNIFLNEPLSAETKYIDSILFYYGIDGNFNKYVFKQVYFTDIGEDYITRSLSNLLQQKNIPESHIKFNTLKSYTFEEDNILKMNFSNHNSYYVNNYYGPDDYYEYFLYYSMFLGYTDKIKLHFDYMNSKEFNDDINRFIDKQTKIRIAGISVFSAGFGLFGLLAMSSLITLSFTNIYNSPPIVVPATLFFSALGSITISLSVGVPLWAVSARTKRYTINFNEQ
ncbi:MAG: hypothetical protein JXB50_01945 [Spirochaetes bacterium]|nr:hypothetical protein [Spirochaetota bacterium]